MVKEPRRCHNLKNKKVLRQTAITTENGRKCLQIIYLIRKGFPGGSVGKESTCNAGDLGSIPELGRSLEKGKAAHSSILAWRIPWTV